MGEPELSPEAEAMLAGLLDGLRALEDLPLEDVAPALGDASPR